MDASFPKLAFLARLFGLLFCGLTRLLLIRRLLLVLLVFGRLVLTLLLVHLVVRLLCHGELLQSNDTQMLSA